MKLKYCSKKPTIEIGSSAERERQREIEIDGEKEKTNQ